MVTATTITATTEASTVRNANASHVGNISRTSRLHEKRVKLINNIFASSYLHINHLHDVANHQPLCMGAGKGKGNKGGKKKKGYMKIFMIGAALKAKLEMLLKLLSFHLQLKFFAIAAIGLIVNIARFWLDVKKGQAPQKVSGRWLW